MCWNILFLANHSILIYDVKMLITRKSDDVASILVNI